MDAKGYLCQWNLGLESDINIEHQILQNTETTEKSATRRILAEMAWKGSKSMSQRDILFVSYEDLEDNLDDLNKPKRCRYGINCLLGQCNCMKDDGNIPHFIE